MSVTRQYTTKDPTTLLIPVIHKSWGKKRRKVMKWHQLLWQRQTPVEDPLMARSQESGCVASKINECNKTSRKKEGGLSCLQEADTVLLSIKEQFYIIQLISGVL